MLRLSRAGFTLLEVLVVLVIIGISIGFVTLTVDTRQEDIEEVVNRFGALVKLASEEAVLQSREYAVQVTPTGYFFLVPGEQGFRALEGDDILRARRFPEDLSLSLLIMGESVELREQESEAEKAEEAPPRIYLLSSGEVTPFELRVEDLHSELELLVTATVTGNVSIERGP